MRKLAVQGLIPRLVAALTVGAMASTSLTPTARAQAGAAAAAPADAPKKPDKQTIDAARKAYGEGEKQFGGGNFAAAYVAFKQAHDILPSPHAEYWMALALDKQGDKPKDTLAAYEVFFANPGHDKLGEEKVTAAKARWEELGKSPGEVSLKTTPAGATVKVDGQAQMGETPTVLKLPGGAHKLSISMAGFDTREMDVTVKPFETIEQTAELTEKAPEAPPPPVVAPPPAAAPPAEKPAEAAEPKSKLPAFITLGIAGAGLVVGSIFGVKALGAHSEYDDHPTSDKADDVERNALISDMAFGVAITLGVTGIVLLTNSGGSEPGKDGSAHRHLPPRAKLRVAPFIGPTGGGAAARWTF